MLPRASGICALALMLCSSGVAHGTDCEPATGISSCVDAQNLWIAPGHSRFIGVASPHTLGANEASIGMAGVYQHRPVVLTVPAPDPDGREVEVVGDAVDASILFALGLGHRAELSVALPMVLHQRGAGVAGAVSQSAEPLTSTAARDPRVGLAWSLFATERGPLAGVGAKTRLVLGVPAGDAQALAGEGGFVLAPTLALGLERGPLALASEVGMRLRATREIAGARLGSQLVTSLGVGVDLLEGKLLGVGLETWLLPSLVSQDRLAPDGTRRADGLLVPAEWLLSLRSAPTEDDSIVLELGAGTGLPLSSERRTLKDGSSETRHFVAVTTPAYRTVLTVRWVAPGS